VIDAINEVCWIFTLIQQGWTGSNNTLGWFHRSAMYCRSGPCPRYEVITRIIRHCQIGLSIIRRLITVMCRSYSTA